MAEVDQSRISYKNNICCTDVCFRSAPNIGKKQVACYGVCFIILMTVSITFYAIGVPIENKFRQSMKSVCTVTNLKTVSSICSSKACDAVSNAPYGVKPTADDCLFDTCYDGLINVQLELGGQNFTSEFKIVNGAHGKNYTEKILRAIYQTGEKIDCYYNSINPNIIDLRIDSASVLIFFAVIINVLALIMIVVFIPMIAHVMYQRFYFQN